MSSILFETNFTRIPADWLNEVNVLLYDVLGGAQTIAAVRTAIGLGSMASQNANDVVISGGTLNGVTIGQVVPAVGVFSNLKTTGNPVFDSDVVNKNYLEGQLSNLTTMAFMDPNVVEITGGLISNTDIRGCPIDSSPVGATNPSTGRFTTLTIQQPLSVQDGGTGVQNFLGRYVVHSMSGGSHLEAIARIPVADIDGLGTLARQNTNNINATGGSLFNINLDASCNYGGLGSMSRQQANAVNITGGRLENVTLVGDTRELAVQQILGATAVDSTKDVFVIHAEAEGYLVDLPNPGLVVKALYFKKLGTFGIGLRAPAGVTIDGQNVYNLFSEYASLTLVSDGTAYHVL